MYEDKDRREEFGAGEGRESRVSGDVGGEDFYEKRRAFSDFSEREDPERVRRMVREEIQRNYRPKRGWFRGFVLILIGSILGSIGTNLFFEKNKAEEANTTTVASEQVVITPGEEVTVEKAVAVKATPSVVGITTLAKSESNFFNYGNVGYSEGVGSGVIVSSDGYILTNSHVIRDGKAVDIDVMFSDNTTSKAELLWYDSSIDLAIIKAEKTGLTPAQLADSDKIAVGDKAIAIGNPLGLSLKSTLTSGVISGLDRTITLQNGLSMEGLLQTDAAINSGNSGGALLDAEGRVIGINTAKTQYSDGIGFAIPINTAKPVVDKVIETGSFRAVLLGIRGIDLNLYAKYSGAEFPVSDGVFVSEVTSNSPASEAGLRAGDIIVAIDGRPVKGMGELKKQLLVFSVGEEAKVSVQRGTDKREITVRFTEQNLITSREEIPTERNVKNKG